jgi:hypothetical protein
MFYRDLGHSRNCWTTACVHGQASMGVPLSGGEISKSRHMVNHNPEGPQNSKKKIPILFHSMTLLILTIVANINH